MTTTITHRNLRYYLQKLLREPQLACGSPHRNGKEWFDKPCTLEFPLGELTRDDMSTLALVGRSPVESISLTGNEGFDAQGIEGKVQIIKPLINALFNMRDLLPEHRGRILLTS